MIPFLLKVNSMSELISMAHYSLLTITVELQPNVEIVRFYDCRGLIVLFRGTWEYYRSDKMHASLLLDAT